ncbi:phage antirepressor N-terminal domain-containing protein [Acinetobacter baumannii]|uniref:phage antirepressor N-terminal domain-containing protein n=1 Tax=Acinetobacter baumannii TaxID=470 RepID=UPI00385A002E
MNMVAQPQTVFFHNSQLSIVEYNNQPYVPMKLVVEGMGLDWKSQYRKIAKKFKTCMVKMTIQLFGDSQSREVVMLPLRKLPAWLYSVEPNKVKPELRDTVIKYQEECDDVLWNHWTGKLNARHKAFDELNAIDMDEKISKAKATLHSHGLHLRKAENKTNKQKRQDWINKNTLLLNFGEEGLA